VLAFSSYVAENVRKNKDGLTVKEIVDQLEAEKSAKGTKVDTNSLFDQLGTA